MLDLIPSIMARGESRRSLVPIIDLGVDLYQTKKLTNMNNELDKLKLGIGMSLVQINSTLDLTIANNQMLREVDSKLQTLSEISWNIASYFDRKEQRDQFIANMRFSIFTFNRKLNDIDKYSEMYPEHALLETEIILELVEKRDLRAEHFAIVSQEEMDRAQKFLDRLNTTRANLVSIIGDSDGV
jgi:hypothetical protein